MRIAILGGTFDPIHYGHLRIAEEVRESLHLNRVLFIPTNIPPHKTREEMTPGELRLKMVGLAIKDNPSFELSDIEIRRGGLSYTIDTVKELKQRSSEELDITLIVGVDSFNYITTWCEYERLFELVDFAVVPRPGYPTKKLAELIPVALARKFWYDSNIDAYMNSYGHKVTYLQTTCLDISSSSIRERIRAGRSVRYLMPPGVEEFIEEQRLYREKEGT